jgi:hypothetical protein
MIDIVTDFKTIVIVCLIWLSSFQLYLYLFDLQRIERRRAATVESLVHQWEQTVSQV